MRAAGIGPHAGKSYLLVGTFLKEQATIGGAEKENGKSTMEKTSVDVGHEVTYQEENEQSLIKLAIFFFFSLTNFFTSLAINLVFGSNKNTPLLHKSYLLFIIRIEIDIIDGGGESGGRGDDGFYSSCRHVERPGHTGKKMIGEITILLLSERNRKRKRK